MDNASLLSLRVGDFLDALASSAPTPGGGAAAALTGASAAALGAMVCALTRGPRFAGVAEQVESLHQQFERARGSLQRLVDEDAAAYGGLSAAFKLPKSAEGRPAAIASAAEWAARVPLETAGFARNTLQLVATLRVIANPQLAADVDSAAALAKAAIAAAAANVRANLPLMAAELRRELETTLERLLDARDRE